jgi:hypothetical protein
MKNMHEVLTAKMAAAVLIRVRGGASGPPITSTRARSRGGNWVNRCLLTSSLGAAGSGGKVQISGGSFDPAQVTSLPPAARRRGVRGPRRIAPPASAQGAWRHACRQAPFCLSQAPPYGTASTISTLVERPFGSEKVAFSPIFLPMIADPSGDFGE